MKIEDSVVKIGDHNAVLNITAFYPSDNIVYTDFNSIISSSASYIIKPNMVSNINILSYMTHKLTYCNLVLVIPNNKNDVFKHIFSSNYSYFFIDLTMSKDSTAKSTEAILKRLEDNESKPLLEKDTFNYSELFLVTNKKLVQSSATAEVYSFSLVSANWWKFNTNIHISTGGLPMSMAAILSLAYAKVGLPLLEIGPGYLHDTSLIYSTTANDNLLTIEGYLKQNLFNLNNLDNTLAISDNAYNCIIIYDTLNAKYKAWSKPTIKDGDLNTIINQKKIVTITVSLTSDIQISNTQGVVSVDSLSRTTKTKQYLKQRETVYQTYDYDTDNIYYNVLSQQIKQKIFLNDNEITKDDMFRNLLYPYDNSTIKVNSANAITNTSNLIQHENNYSAVIPDINTNRYAIFSSTSDDKSLITDDLEYINFNTDTMVITLAPSILFNVGQVIYVKYTTNTDIAKDDLNSYELFNGFYMIKSINLALGINKADALVLTVAKYCLS